MLRGLRILALLSVLALCGAIAAVAQGLALAPLKGEAASLHWEGAQFLQADAQGQVFLLRSDPLEIYPLSRSHDLGKPVRVGAHGPGGRLYVLAGPGAVADGNRALDRIEWDSRRVERLPLTLPCVGRFSMAAGHDGLYLAGYNGESGRYFVSWDALEAGHWTAVASARFTP